MRHRLVITLIFLTSLTLGVVSEHESRKQDSIGDDHDHAEPITIKLDPAVKRNKEHVRAMVNRLRKLPELTGATLAAASRDLLVLVPAAGQSIDELKDTLLQQLGVYELEVGEHFFRRPGDKPYDQLRKEKLAEALSSTKTKLHEQIRDKLRSLLKVRTKRGPAKAAAAEGGDASLERAEKAKKLAAKAIKRAAKRAARRAKRRAAKEQAATEEL